MIMYINLVGLDQVVNEPDYNEVTPSHVKFVILAGILLPLFCLMYMCCISIVLLCREHYLSLNYDKLDTRRLVVKTYYLCCNLNVLYCSCIKRSLEFVRRRVMVMFLVCRTCLSRCKMCKKDFNALPLSDNEIFYGSSQGKTFDSNLGKKGSKVNKVMQKGHPSKRYHSSKPARHLHHYKPEHSSTWHDNNRVEEKQKTDKYYHKSSKRTCEDTKAHCSEKHQIPTHGTRVNGGKYQGIENLRLPHKVSTKPFVREIKKSRVTIPSKSHSNDIFSHHRTSRFRPSRGPNHDYQHSGSQDASNFEHQPSHKLLGPFSTQYCHGNNHVTVQQPTKSPSQHSSKISHSTCQEPVKSTAESSEQSSRRIFQSSLPHHSESNTQGVKSRDRDLSHYQQHSKPSASKSHRHRMQRDLSIIESSGSSISPEEVSGLQALHYTSSASGVKKPFISATDKYYSLFEPNDGEIQVSTSVFTRSSDSTFIPICSTADKINIFSSSENFDLISLSSNTTQAGGGDLDSVMDALH